ncbi:neutral/alkaline non-lysosomal ceramidase N-terminal domain-containing protein [Pyxidicoccus xibeiensis]|uniref:neutral/alkaline non-lysosomal ceramidase N-terminal domain-containing protein n=1 Tax=Pyxidicoccus xibeiensis TaxID=2906759 RepID=UPI0020A73F5D|nr:neutral/alkaline non-lysosomal ceramidase N-terminal domain-containing protein [Pyxidicoccus xibeiensis]MCP3142381.1 neutral/alkaline ceramidase [Pyxidicoccus xibeiensis]
MQCQSSGTWRLAWVLALLALGGCASKRAPEATALRARAQGCQGQTDFEVGTGLYDITGPAAQVMMMGYVKAGQNTAGIHQRLRSRAFVIASPCNGKRVVFVSADLGMLFQAVQQSVLRKLRERYGEDLYTDANVLLSATHTHAGPGGYSHHALYNHTFLGIPFIGFVPQNFEAIAEGIFQSIVRAHDNLAPGRIRVNTGNLPGASDNRSARAYERNPLEERSKYAGNVDTAMTLLRLEAAPPGASEPTPVGMVNWFAVHATSMTNTNRLISGDNKGYASYLFEKRLDTDYGSPKTFVAAFAQSNEGDVTPNVYGGGDGRGEGELAATEEAGRRQFELAWKLFEDTAGARPLTGGVDSRHTYVKMDAVKVEPRWADGQERRTCKAALGISMLAGAEDGRGVGREGVRCGDPLAGFLCGVDNDPCQAEKPVALKPGEECPIMSPNVLPLQIVRLGNLALVAVPFEMTTMAGRRLRETVRERLAPAGVEHVVIAGLSNAYSGYLTTRQEYAQQDYEGASTHFGPWQLAAVQQESAKLAEALAAGTDVPRGPKPKPPGGRVREIRLSHTYDEVPRADPRFGTVTFGSVVSGRDAGASYPRCATASATFWGGHPRNNLHTQGSFLEVQRRQEDGSWVPVAYDWDWETKYRWKGYPCPPRGACSHVTVEWDIPEDTPPGTYRLRHAGEWRPRPDEPPRPYTGVSREFSVTEGVADRCPPGAARSREVSEVLP